MSQPLFVRVGGKRCRMNAVVGQDCLSADRFPGRRSQASDIAGEIINNPLSSSDVSDTAFRG